MMFTVETKIKYLKKDDATEEANELSSPEIVRPSSGPSKQCAIDNIGTANKGCLDSEKNVPRGGRDEKRSRTITTSSVSYGRFQKKTCIYFCENIRKEGQRLCCCGRPELQHNSEALLNKCIGVKWDINHHVKKCTTNAYGEVEFYGSNRKTRAKYIRLSNDSNADDALKLLLKEWKLEYPKLLVSVTGGAKTFKLPVKLKQQFRDGLFKVAQTTGAWVITGGTNTGVMKHVGEALQVASASKGFSGSVHDETRRRVYCIGIATWGIIEHRKQLTEHGKSAVKYFMKNSIESDGACLDNNHTHFFLVDNGTVNRYGAEIKFRALLEKRIMKMDVDKNRGGVPAVLLVLEGGPNTILTVYEALNQDPAIPVVIIKDSGRAADLLAFTHNISQGEGPLYDMGDVVEHKQLLKKIEQTFPEMDQSGCLRVYANLLKCVKKKHLITIFKMEEGTADIDQAILTALLKSKSTSPEEQLELALIWNRADIARSKIFNEDLKWPLASLEYAMKVALEKDRTEFVQLFLEHGVNMGTFLTKDRLEGLYCVRSTKGKSLMKYLLGSEKCKSGAIRLRDIGDVFTRLTGLKTEYASIDMVRATIPSGAARKLSQSFEQPFNELFIWAALNNMQKMALCFWKLGEESMAKALIACKLYLSMARYAEKRDLKDDVIESLNTNRGEFQQLAVQLLDQCFLSDEKRSNRLLTYDLSKWGHSTCLTLAVSSEHEIFVAHSCCQALLSDMWAGAMSFRTYQSLKTIFCMFFPPMIVKLDFRSKDDIRDMPQTEEQHEEYEKEEKEERENRIEMTCDTGSDEVKFKGQETQISSFSESEYSLVATIPADTVTLSSSDVTIHNSLKWWEKILEFYAAPITKFWGNVLSYLVFLCLFTYVVLGRITEKLESAEIVLLIFVLSLTTEELRQFLQSDSTRFCKKLLEWSQNKWNLCDGIAITLFYIGFILRLNNYTLSAGHLVYSIDIMFWIVRLLDIFSVNQHLGPYVVMIGRMTIDLMYFLFIMAVFLSAYGVARQAILAPESSTTWKSISDVFFTPYWQTYGELFIEKEHLYSSSKTYFGTKKYNSYSEPIVSLLMALYLLVANILLLNLLIAIFNNTFAEVQANSNKIWKFQRYHLIMEYSRRPSLVPPFVILNHILSLCKNIYLKCRCCKKGDNLEHRWQDQKMKFFPKASELADLLQFEEECLAEYSRKKDGLYLTSKEERIRLILERVDRLWQAKEAKKDILVEKKQMEMSINRLEDKLEIMSKNLVGAMTNIFEKYLDADGQQASHYNASMFSLPKEVVTAQNNDFESRSEKNGKPLVPRRFLSHNPYLHMPIYDNKTFVKKAAWNFRKFSLKGENPSKETLVDALQNETSKDFDENVSIGEDTVDAPVAHKLQEHKEDEKGQRKRCLSCPQRISFENDDDISQITLRDRPDNIIDANTGSACNGMEALTNGLDMIYPMTDIERFQVPDHLLSWEIDFPDYEPSSYTSPTLINFDWVDPETPEGLKFNDMDGGIDRISDYCDYDVVCGYPRNPFGRTGLAGRGLLPRWGPNHAVEAIVTRWKRSPNGEKFFRESSLHSLEFLLLKRNNNLVIPSGLVTTKQQTPKVISDLFLLDSEDKQSAKEPVVQEFFSQGYEVSRARYDSRNTDNAWIELRTINYHDDEGNATRYLNLNHSNITWKEFDSESVMESSSKNHLAKICQLRNAHFCD